MLTLDRIVTGKKGTQRRKNATTKGQNRHYKTYVEVPMNSPVRLMLECRKRSVEGLRGDGRTWKLETGLQTWRSSGTT